MFASIKNRWLSNASSPDIPAGRSTSDEHSDRSPTAVDGHPKQLTNKFPYARPEFLQISTSDELRASADKHVRPIIVPRDIHILPWSSGYAECINSGKSLWNEDQAAYCHQILSDPSNQYPDLPYTYFGIFDGHGGFGAALAAALQFHHILYEKLVECVDLLLPRKQIESHKATIHSDTFPQLSHFHKYVQKEDLIKGALESAFVHMDAAIGHDRGRYRNAGGCTACVALFINGQMYVANAGDSRAVLCRRKDSSSSTEVPFSFDHTPERERTRLLGMAHHKPHLLGRYYTPIEFARSPQECYLGQRVLCRQGTMKGWTYKTLTRDDLKLPVISGQGRRSRLLGTLAVTRGFGDHDLVAGVTGIPVKPFLTAQPEINYGQLKYIVATAAGVNTDADYAILVMATDGLWHVCRPNDASRIVFNTLDKHPGEKHRYTMVAQKLVAKGRGKINENGHWRSGESNTISTGDDVSVVVIPVYQYYREHIEWEQKCWNEYRDRLNQQSHEAIKLRGAQKQMGNKT